MEVLGELVCGSLASGSSGLECLVAFGLAVEDCRVMVCSVLLACGSAVVESPGRQVVLCHVGERQ